MKHDDLKRNASGYIDEPCYQAVTAGPRPGEIYAHTMSSDYMLILSTQGNVSACLKLEDKPREGKIRVLARVPLYTDPLKVCYCFHDLLGAYIKSVPDAEFAGVRRAVARALGLTKEVLR